jgi:hypothetical protein
VGLVFADTFVVNTSAVGELVMGILSAQHYVFVSSASLNAFAKPLSFERFQVLSRSVLDNEDVDFPDVLILQRGVVLRRRTSNTFSFTSNPSSLPSLLQVLQKCNEI